MSTNKVAATRKTRYRYLSSPQSKQGCYTCRARRKKCDEQKPTCRRCGKAGLVCEGYKSNEPNGIMTPLSWAISSRPLTDSTHARLSQLGQELLLQQAGCNSLSISASIWTEVLPQLNVMNECVNAAVTCLGSIYEVLFLRQSGHMGQLGQHYRRAISLLQNEISSPSHGKVPIFLTCIVLAAVEVLQRRLTNAVLHLRGAFQVLAAYEHEMVNSEDLRRLAQALDIQTSTYALGQPPDLPPMSYDMSVIGVTKHDHPNSLNHLHSELFPFLHTCYHYCYTASKYKYKPPNKIPQPIILDQSRYIALLAQWISRLDVRMSAHSMNEGFVEPSLIHSFTILRLQCVSAMIYLSSALNPHEKAYDSYTYFFQQIVDGATFLLSPLQPKFYHSSSTPFQIISPLAQPLYLTAMKCRKSEVRQEAIRLLSCTGKEGPWDSSILVSIATRVSQLEQQSSMHDIVPESYRIHGCGVISEGGLEDNQNRIEVQLSRCIDIRGMLACSDWESQSNWDIWTEVLPVHEEQPIIHQGLTFTYNKKQ